MPKSYSIQLSSWNQMRFWTISESCQTLWTLREYWKSHSNHHANHIAINVFWNGSTSSLLL